MYKTLLGALCTKTAYHVLRDRNLYQKFTTMTSTPVQMIKTDDDDSRMFDDDDINCEIRNMFVRTNMLLHRFDNNSSVAVKRMLFKS